MSDSVAQNAIVTGAGSGNGKAIAELLLSQGANVALLDISPESLADTASRFPAAVPISVDVADPESVSRAVACVKRDLGHVDLLVNNAGIVRSTKFTELSLDEWNEVFAVNAAGPFLVSQATMPLLRAAAAARGPQSTAAIVNITSVEAHIVISSSGHPQVHYNASKGALLQFTRALSIDCAKDRVRVNAVAPGFIETPFTQSTLDNPVVKEWLLERTPLGRIGKPSDVAEAVAFLGGEQASWITGTTLFVDGGWTVY
ncbi:SDR family NAD(P)-dependent oxidoreductase [Mycobacterium sp. smrl_JER01]|uniref:SDR family NAD(P)-dependent oxidoreductase n=1 Tax=Mycobacterium sp. smrl_JER01 TaxID=3402633 RepID=UPI003ABE7181